MNEAAPLLFTGLNQARWRGRTLLHFSGCDYFRLARSRALAAAARRVLRQHGLSVAASRVTTGNHPLYVRLERELARFFGAETALLLPDGYDGPLAVAQALAGGFTHAFLDELAHGALADAAPHLGCPVQMFRHRDADDLGRRLRRAGPRARPVVLTDGLFAHDGSVAPLRAYLRQLPAGGRLLVDDAHGAGVLGATGRGSLQAAGVGRQRIIQCATLSKAFGAYGGVVLGSRRLRAQIVARSRVFSGTTPPPLPLAGAALAALRALRAADPRRPAWFLRVARLRARLRAAGWRLPDQPGPILRLPGLPEPRVRNLRRRLLAAGIYPSFTRYTASPAAAAFRFVISFRHSQADLNRLAAALGGPE